MVHSQRHVKPPRPANSVFPDRYDKLLDCAHVTESSRQWTTSPPRARPAGASRVGAWEQRIERIAARIRPWSWLWPPMAFLAGVGSFFLVERQQWLGAMLTLGMLLTWFLLLSESLIGRFLAQRGYPTLPRGVTTFIAQMVHQETLFFTLPFLLATTVWTSGQALFTLSMVALAILSILDPLYYRLAERRRGLYFAFHAQCVFLVVLVTLPTLLHLTTGQSLLLALAATVIFSLPSLLHLLRPMTARRWLLMLALLPVLAGGAWAGRIWVPPASLWISGSALSPEFNVETRSPQGQLRLTQMPWATMACMPTPPSTPPGDCARRSSMNGATAAS
nr:DUF5924 family protein [Halomonas elongata]